MLFKIKVSPKAKLNKIERIGENEYRIWTTAAPDKGKANQSVIEMLAKEFGVAKSGIAIVKGEKAKNKTLKIVAND